MIPSLAKSRWHLQRLFQTLASWPVLLSSLPGAAVTSIRVSDVAHEFSAIPHVREDMMRLILNIKQLRVQLIEAESARVRLEVKLRNVGIHLVVAKVVFFHCRYDEGRV